ncbi:MAG: hypothetical protein ACRDQA_21170, partial [Nocardioidaceae bacterium]
ARDQAEWAITLAEEGTAGTFNSASPTPPFGFGDLLEATVRAVGPRGTTLSWADPEWLVQQGETFQSLPLWTGPEPEWVLAADTTAAISTGLAPRPLTDTITDTWEWIKAEQPPLVPGWGISSQREAELLRNRIPG